MGKFVDLTGQRFGRLVVLGKNGKQKDKTYWDCICDCGKITKVETSKLKSGHTKSCGCYMRERAKEANIKHGMFGTKLYNTYCRMKQRCYDKNYPKYKNYGFRGIGICEQWLGKDGFINFYNWAMDNGFNENLSIERIDVNGNYEPDNCKWITMAEQAKNKTTTIKVKYKNNFLTLIELCEKLNLNYKTIWSRIHNGWDIDKAITQPIRQARVCEKSLWRKMSY